MIDGLRSERVDLDSAGQVMALLTLDRPDQLNPLDHDMVVGIRRYLDEVAQDDTVRVVAITGAGRAFSAGGDLKAYRKVQADPERFSHFLEDFRVLVGRLTRHPKPCIALVNGVCVAGGTELALACDFVYASRSARIGDGHQVWGQIGGGGALTFLPSRLGMAQAKELILSGCLLDAETACSVGLVNRVVDDPDLRHTAVTFAREVARHSPLSIRRAKEVMAESMWGPAGAETAMEIEQRAALAYCTTSHDAPEGLAAFADKRRPHFLGR